MSCHLRGHFFQSHHDARTRPDLDRDHTVGERSLSYAE
jgi:hypothetical protein